MGFLVFSGSAFSDLVEREAEHSETVLLLCIRVAVSLYLTQI